MPSPSQHDPHSIRRSNQVKLSLWSCIVILTFGSALTCTAGGTNPGTTAPPREPFGQGATEIELLGGAFFSVDASDSSKPTINLAVESFRFGIMLTDPHQSGFLAGNVEFLSEGFAAQVFAGPGSTVAGVNLMLRYNFLHFRAWAVPYFQIAAGGAYNNIAHTQSESLVGSEFEFCLHSEAGLRVRLSERLSLMAEGGLFHLSNAGFADRNHGLNSLGGRIGMAISL